MNVYKIVVVENDRDEQLFMEQAFKTCGMFQILAMLRSGDALFEWLAAHPHELPDIILSDLNMPGKNGYDIIAGVRDNPALQHIPVIITSTSSIRVVMDRCLEMGAAYYLVKPDTFLDYETYVGDLHRLLDARGMSGSVSRQEA